MHKIKKPELISPAGDFEKLKTAFHFGADAVYAGLEEFSLRAKAKNFNFDELKEAVTYTHELNKKIYIALNIYFTPGETDNLIEYLKKLKKIKPDALIVSDYGALFLINKYCPEIPVHISTQANITNQYAVKFLNDYNVKRIVLARELTLDEIKIISSETKTELEAFIHGAMCISYSGRCLLSSYMTHQGLGKRKDDDTDLRSANKGNCSHSCRWEFIIKEKTRIDQDYTAYENEDGTYIFSSKDICMIDHIAELLNAGVKHFKIEGRMKSILYISSIVRAYRRAIDNYFDKSIDYNRSVIDNELNIVSHREFSTGFFFTSPKETANTTKGGLYNRQIRLAALITDVKENRAVLKVYNTIKPEDNIEYIGPDMLTIKIKKIIFFDENGCILNIVKHNEFAEAEMYDQKDNLIKPAKLNILRIEAKF